MLCGFIRIFWKRYPDSNTLAGTAQPPTEEAPPPYSEAPPPFPKPGITADDARREFTPEETNRRILQGLYAQREELLDTIEDEPFTVHQAKLQLKEALSNYGKAGWGEEGRREYNRAESKYQMIQAKHRQHQRKLREIEGEIHQVKARRR